MNDTHNDDEKIKKIYAKKLLFEKHEEFLL
jgi:hypothetical protein